MISRNEAMKLACAPRVFLMLREDCLVATGAVFEDGTTVLRWRRSEATTEVRRSFELLREAHKDAIFEFVGLPSEAFNRGYADCAQDTCENAPFASVGGLGARKAMARPHWVPESDWPEYLRGYQAGAALCHGDGWEDAKFGWSPALTLGEEEAER